MSINLPLEYQVSEFLTSTQHGRLKQQHWLRGVSISYKIVCTMNCYTESVICFQVRPAKFQLLVETM